MSVGNVTIRFSVQDAEVVRKALEQLGKDGEAALRRLDTAGKPVSRTMGAVSEVVSDLRMRAQASADSLGVAGVALARLGPAGLAAGAALGVTMGALFKVIEGVDQLADKAGRIRDFAEQVGLTVSQVQAFEIAGTDVGVSAEKIAAGLGKLSAEMEATRRGTGALFEAAQRINPAFAEELARARDLTQFIDRLAQAWDTLTESQRNALSRAAFGRGIDLGRVLGLVSEAGGVDELEKRLQRSIVLTEDQAKKLDDLKDAAERLRNSAWDRIWSIFAEATLRERLETAEWLDRVSRKLKDISEIDIKQSVIDLLTGRPERNAPGLMESEGFLPPTVPTPVPASSPTVVPPASVPVGVPLPPARPRIVEPQGPLSPEAALTIERQRMAILGAAATPAEQLRLKMKELAAATDDWTRNQAEGNRALAAFVQGQARAATAARTRIGIVGEEELLTRALMDRQEMRRNGFIRSDEEMAEAERIMRKEVRATAEALEVRASGTPALTRLAQDADKLALNLDQGLASALHSSTASIIDMAKGTETLSAGLTNLSTKILEAVANALLMKSVVGPIANALSGGLSSLFPSAQGLVPFARGGIVSRPAIFPFAGGTGLMGERGPEAIMPLSRLPDGRLGVSTAGGAGPVTVNVINAPAGVERVRSAPDGNGGTRIDVELRRMVEDMGERMLSDRGSPWARALSRTLGVNPARTIA
jgi:hypothetical protein